ncbi:MAG TPA: S8 family peptidase [Flavobacterium sp.]|uniref:S8 family peptidase n=1 Tax=unclassified Flavobacterium TaxID=196869 RepID=UPI0025C1BCA7|nr:MULTISPECIES: S8 family peptidase [unclassified Flavobacterium]HRE77909.1 S8 family peptidase [Flavobacterium sp.]
MKLIRSTAFTLLSALILTGCGASKSSFTNLKPLSSETVPLKNSKISDAELLRWSHLDLIKDTIPGMSVDRAYEELLKNKKGQKVIVAVIDSGTDIEHEDLKGRVWTNAKEIPGNGIDDDNNGYIDDIHGWNFLGDIVHETLELTRIVRKGDDGSETYKKALAKLEEKKEEALSNKQQIDFIVAADKGIAEHLKKENYTLQDVKSILTSNPTLGRYKMAMLQFLANSSREEFMKGVKEYEEHVYDQLNYNLNTEYDGRKILGDNYEDFSTKFYGNNQVWGPDKKHALHGTHVAGIIAQVRGNNLGGDGVATNVEIMAIRAVPNGDEYDKDIALAIRYAADNGAKIINGSFGKGFSPQKEWVYEAIKYAASKDVLFVHAAGNDGDDLNVVESFPNDRIADKEIADNFIKIGALNFDYGAKTVAEFSNYGKTDVDVFAPGVKIYATVPDNKYEHQQGTSMASPNAAGVAALIRSYYPTLTAPQVKMILKESGVSINKTVVVGGDPTNKLPFAELSTSGKIVNAYNALLMADKMAKSSGNVSK